MVGPKPVAMQQKVDVCVWSHILCIGTTDTNKNNFVNHARRKTESSFHPPFRKITKVLSYEEGIKEYSA